MARRKAALDHNDIPPGMPGSLYGQKKAENPQPVVNNQPQPVNQVPVNNNSVCYNNVQPQQPQRGPFERFFLDVLRWEIYFIIFFTIIMIICRLKTEW